MSLIQSAVAALESGFVCAAGVFNKTVMLNTRQSTPKSHLKSHKSPTLVNNLDPHRHVRPRWKSKSRRLGSSLADGLFFLEALSSRMSPGLVVCLGARLASRDPEWGLPAVCHFIRDSALQLSSKKTFAEMKRRRREGGKGGGNLCQRSWQCEESSQESRQ